MKDILREKQLIRTHYRGRSLTSVRSRLQEIVHRQLGVDRHYHLFAIESEHDGLADVKVVLIMLGTSKDIIQNTLHWH